MLPGCWKIERLIVKNNKYCDFHSATGLLQMHSKSRIAWTPDILLTLSEMEMLTQCLLFSPLLAQVRNSRRKPQTYSSSSKVTHEACPQHRFSSHCLN